MTFINILSLYSYSVFDDIVIPDGADREILINTIIDKCGQNEPLYADGELLKQKIDNFFLKNKRTFDRLFTAYMLDYDQISNYDRNETYTEYVNSDGVSDNKVSAYDSSDFVNDSKNSSNNNISTTRNSKISGNIGVTTSAQMLTQEIEILPKLNFYEIVANYFYSEFCLQIM